MKVTTQPLVSVVTPAYNEEQYLAECIESVLAQTYQNWNYTIVNNCSTDRTLDIARSYAAKDPRIRVHDNEEFLKMLANHNLALRQISPESKYCKVVLADDWIFPECLEKMVAVAEANPSVGVVSSYQLHGRQVRSAGLSYEQNLVSGREVCRQFLLQRLILFGTQNSVLYRSDLVRARDPFYIETDICADFEVCFALLSTTDLGFVHQVLTFSRPRPGSFGTISFDVGANYGSLLNILFTYGRQCLSDEEFGHCFDLQLSQYYRFLGRRIWMERDREFWAYHKAALAALGIELRNSRVMLMALKELLFKIPSPTSLREIVERRFSLKKIRTSQMRSVIPGLGGKLTDDGHNRKSNS